jgi:hypothetical protein
MTATGLKLASFRRFRHNRAVALFALIALFFATTAYVAHGYEHDISSSSHAVAHCDLCLHFSGTAGTPAAPEVVGKPPLEARAPAVAEIHDVYPQPHPTNHLPRGPPALTLS